MSAPQTPAAPAGTKGNNTVKIVAIILMALGAIFFVVGIGTYAMVSNTLADEQITVSDDADFLGGDDVDGPFSAYAQADIIAKHAEEIADGKTYAELAQDDERRPTVMNASFLRASLFTSVVAFGVAALVAGLGVLFALVGWAMLSLSKPATE
ncbi:aromatic ring-opening dioxygenase LigA [Nocardioides sp. GY 10113]|uniref:aromatic ring-opening dioxygenase LigA n=1 Tax=Nocardioides sp. GY 10113 TaxID=2569761 RepID=UPI0010A79AA9|nr:aromatic ring-opening dioxygenase LigA [Nocardioides sp. GY 10113]TIC83544.1 aromatic ring-opening dioxygenase LigA [Nocardioides sp. GY 10113]